MPFPAAFAVCRMKVPCLSFPLMTFGFPSIDFETLLRALLVIGVMDRTSVKELSLAAALARTSIWLEIIFLSFNTVVCSPRCREAAFFGLFSHTPIFLQVTLISFFLKLCYFCANLCYSFPRDTRQRDFFETRCPRRRGLSSKKVVIPPLFLGSTSVVFFESVSVHSIACRSTGVNFFWLAEDPLHLTWNAAFFSFPEMCFICHSFSR